MSLNLIIFAKVHFTEAIDLGAKLTCCTGVNTILPQWFLLLVDL